MKILGVGLSKTGTTSLSGALNILGFKSIHWCPERLNDIVNGLTNIVNFKKFDDVDAVFDIPAAYFWREIWEVYPNIKFILTERNIDDWYKSIVKHYKPRNDILAKDIENAVNLRKIVYGSDKLNELIYKKKYKDHVDFLKLIIPSEKLLIINIFECNKWNNLCEFLEVKIPNITFPHKNKRKILYL